MVKDTKILRWVKGNDMLLSVTVTEMTDDGGERVPVIEQWTDVSVTAATAYRRTPLQWYIEAGTTNVMAVEIPATLPCGLYGLEVMGMEQGVLPQAVHQGTDGMLSLEYQTVALTAGIAAARKAVDNERRIMELENEVVQLKRQIADLTSN
jgi:hypothetical protein